MSAKITVDLDAALPPYEQIRSQVATFIALGELPEGSRLPTVRALATDLGVATGTVARAYKELEAQGLVQSRRRAGTVVAAGHAKPHMERDILQAVDDLLALARAQGVDETTLIALIRRRS
ncbi:GntR family transcriptional regulator [Glutamicibacter endophyticus]|uniref:GntR family transcriptional regulator n=1 Tax=Glutamicibacter endophyticus TaxID=1522174 RepID=UPI003AF06DC9